MTAIRVNLKESELGAEFQRLREHVSQEVRRDSSSSHEFMDDLEGSARADFSRILSSPKILSAIQECYPDCDVESVDSMNEIYVSANRSSGSDKVFITNHIDGPFFLVPFCILLRGIIVLEEDVGVVNHFPMSRESFSMQKGEACLFDYNRCPHRIDIEPPVKESGQRRVVLKAHYTVVPRSLGWMGKLFRWANTAYNTAARRAFLRSIETTSIGQKMLSALINGVTKVWCRFEMGLGFFATLVMGLLAVLWLGTGASLKEGVYAASFLHYALYLLAHVFQRIPFGQFVRDAVIFKMISFGLLFGIYLTLPLNFPSLAIVACGMGLSTLAYWRLGRDRTYFGRLFGVVDERRVTGFPYGVVPHPMILGSVVGIGGMLIHSEFREGWGMLAIGHIVAYLIVLATEVRGWTVQRKFSFEALFEEFDRHHQRPGNVIGHVLTVALGLFGLMGVVEELVSVAGGSTFAVGALVVYGIVFGFYSQPTNVALAQAFFLLSVFGIFQLGHPSGVFVNLGILALATVMQELCHLLFGERTVASSWRGRPGAWLRYALLTVFLPGFLMKRFLGSRGGRLLPTHR